jgi:flagellar protein FliO/FliZ
MELSAFFQAIGALIFVLALIGLTALIMRKYGQSALMGIRAGKARRLSIEEILPIDAKTRVVILKRDEVEHVVVLRGENVVELGEASVVHRPSSVV